MITNEKFRVILADPNWSYDNFGAKKHGAARGHYAGSPLDVLSRIPVARWADKHCILALWATWPKLDVAIDLMRAWGFKHVTGLPWVKTTPDSGEIRCGIGFWFQSASEVLLWGRRGNAKAPKGDSPVRGLVCGSEKQFYNPIRGHSSKPMSLYDFIEERLKGPYLELFARNIVHGWTCIGHETGWELYEGGVRPYVKPQEKQNGGA